MAFTVLPYELILKRRSTKADKLIKRIERLTGDLDSSDPVARLATQAASKGDTGMVCYWLARLVAKRTAGEDGPEYREAFQQKYKYFKRLAGLE